MRQYTCKQLLYHWEKEYSKVENPVSDSEDSGFGGRWGEKKKKKKNTFAGAQEAAVLHRIVTSIDQTSSTKRIEYQNSANSDRNMTSCSGVGSSYKHANLQIYLAMQCT